MAAAGHLMQRADRQSPTREMPVDRLETEGKTNRRRPTALSRRLIRSRSSSIPERIMGVLISLATGYEDWPCGRIVFDRARDLFVLYADRKLLTPATIAPIATQFCLPAERTEVQSDFHYQSTETTIVLET
jgi:hypothetical protein